MKKSKTDKILWFMLDNIEWAWVGLIAFIIGIVLGVMMGCGGDEGCGGTKHIHWHSHDLEGLPNQLHWHSHEHLFPLEYSQAGLDSDRQYTKHQEVIGEEIKDYIEGSHEWLDHGDCQGVQSYSLEIGD